MEGIAGHELVCLLPARNCAGEIPAYLDSVAGLADAIVALDDGSTDETAAVLEASPEVVRLLRNPRRDSYAGWDDAANRQALLDAAIELGARWALFLDADERIDPDDARALRRFVEHVAVPGSAYGFRVHRMLGDGTAYDRADLWVYRLFAPAAGQRLPTATLHLVPIPTSIPRDRWQKTTVRIQHFAGATAELREARLDKYRSPTPTTSGRPSTRARSSRWATRGHGARDRRDCRCSRTRRDRGSHSTSRRSTPRPRSSRRS